MTFTAAGDVTTTTGEIEVNAGAAGLGLVTMADGTLFNAGSGQIDVNGQGNVQIGELLTTNSGVLAVEITTTDGGVLDADAGGIDVTAAGRLVDLAQNGVGAGNELETRLASLDVRNTASGNIELFELAIAGGGDNALDVVRATNLESPSDSHAGRRPLDHGRGLDHAGRPGDLDGRGRRANNNGDLAVTAPRSTPRRARSR